MHDLEVEYGRFCKRCRRLRLKYGSVQKLTVAVDSGSVRSTGQDSQRFRAMTDQDTRW